MHLSAEEPSTTTTQTYRQAIRSFNPMGLAGVDSQVASILRNYYIFNYTDSESWRRVESIRFRGRLHLPHASFWFVAYKKKPDYSRVVIYSGAEPVLVMAYDGEDAWQIDSAHASEPVAMLANDALNFIRDAATAGHLMYPSLPGKTIELRGSTEIDGRNCFELLITLPNGQQITSIVDKLTFEELRQVTTNAATGSDEVVHNTKFEIVDGIRLSVASDKFVEGKKAHSIEIDEITYNVGVMPWMFARESGAYIPELERLAASLHEAAKISSEAEVDTMDANAASTGPSFSPFARKSAFDEVDLSEISVLEGLGVAPEQPERLRKTFE